MHPDVRRSGLENLIGRLEDPLCAALWNRIDGRRTAQDIVTDFCDEYEVATDQLAKDFTSLLDDLLSIQAVEEIAR